MSAITHNTKTLEQFLLQLQNQVKKDKNFTSKRVNRQEIAVMLLEGIQQDLNNKENINPNSQQRHQKQEKSQTCLLDQSIDQKDILIDKLQQQILLESSKTKKFFEQMRKQPLLDENLLGFRINRTETNPLDASSIHFHQCSQNDSVRRSSQWTNNDSVRRSNHDSVRRSNQTVQLTQSVSDFSLQGSPLPPLPFDKMSSITTKNSEQSGCLSKRNSVRGESRNQSKSKTFSKLLKIQALVKKESSKNAQDFRVGKYIQEMGSIDVVREVRERQLNEENQNYKSINQSLSTHLQLLQKYKKVPSLIQLAEWQQKLRKRELDLKQLGEQLQSKERNINRRHTQFLQTRRSINKL